MTSNPSPKMLKIRNKATGLYSPGGSEAIFPSSWKKGGKVWAGMGPLKNHLNLIMENPARVEGMEDWEVVEYEVIERSTTPVVMLIDLVKILKKNHATR